MKAAREFICPRSLEIDFRAAAARAEEGILWREERIPRHVRPWLRPPVGAEEAEAEGVGRRVGARRNGEQWRADSRESYASDGSRRAGGVTLAEGITVAIARQRECRAKTQLWREIPRD